jgi:PAS domain S-box-containing protein
MKPFRSLPLRAKLVATYIALGVGITLISLLGGRIIEDRAFSENLRSAELLRSTQVIATIAKGATEEAFSFVVSGDLLEKDKCLGGLDEAEARIGALRSETLLTDAERADLVVLIDATQRVRNAARVMFRSYEETLFPVRLDYQAFEKANDELTDAITNFSSLAGAESTRELGSARIRSQILTVLVGLVAVAIAAAFGITFGRRITAPLLSLRRAVLAFDEGQLDAKIEEKSSDEIGELASAFEKMAEDTRRHITQRFDDIFASITDCLVVSKADGTISAANPACSQLSGHTEQEIVGRPVSWLFASVDLAGRGDVETTLRAADGRQIPVRLSASRLRGRGDDGIVLVARDLSERQQLEAELRQAQKMEAIGRLAGGVAHDFNNMLNVILGYSTMLLDDLTPSNPWHDPLSEIKRAGERSAELTHQLLAFSRQEPVEGKIVDLNEAIQGTLRMVRRVLGEDVDMATAFAAEPCCTNIAPGQVEQILMNLVVNARDAMPNGGTLIVGTALVDLTEAGAAQHNGARPGRYSMVSVSDNGTGMDATTLERIFEPFFTTKDQGKGTGLGLSTVFGIVRQNGGYITVDSAVGVGTTFRLYFQEGHVANDVAQSISAPSGAPLATATVLLVEDEDQVRTLIDRVLRREGYRVLTASRPEEALRMSSEHQGLIDLLLTDVIMPQMNGRELADRLLAARPDMKVLYMSGYTHDVVLQQGVSNVSFLQKPVTPEALDKKVRGMLASTVNP